MSWQTLATMICLASLSICVVLQNLQGYVLAQMFMVFSDLHSPGGCRCGACSETVSIM